MPVAMMETGSRAKVTAVTGADAVRKHLGSLGVVPGTVVQVVQVMSGNMILGVQDARIAVNDDLARRVIVQPL